MKVWIVDDRTSKEKTVKQVDFEKVIDHPWCPPNMKQYNYRKLPGGGFKWSYVHYGQTREEAVASYNKLWIEKCDEARLKFETEIAMYKAHMVE